ncbi:MAG: flagellar hook-basal body complex protein, partial [Planctomycetota bacterium]
ESDTGNGLAYTRAGNFSINSDGELVLANSEGRRLIPEIVVPEGATNITISSDGTVNVALPGQIEPSEIGVIELATFINPTGLKQIGENLFQESEASGPAEIGQPLEDSRGRLLQGFLESSNVDPVKELVKLIRTQRAFEMNSQSIQAADEALQTLANLRRF